MLSCPNAQEVRSTGNGPAKTEQFDHANILGAYPCKEGSSNALLLQSAGGAYSNILEMQASSSSIEINTIGSIIPSTASPVIALYLDTERDYGFMMHENGAFHYFKYASA